MKNVIDNGAKRKNYIQYLRIICMISVVLIHVCMSAVTVFEKEVNDNIAILLYYSIKNVLVFAVPIFFMISGALLLNTKKEITITKLIHRYILKYLTILLIFGWGFAICEEIFTNYTEYGIGICVTNGFINMIQGKSWTHMWYMYSLVGVMLLLPLLRAVADKFDKVEIKYTMYITFLCLSVFPTIENLANISIGIQLPLNYCCAYMLIGYWIDAFKVKLKKKTCVATMIFCAMILLVDAYFYVYKDTYLFLCKYYSPIVWCLSVSLFSYAKQSWNVDLSDRVGKVLDFMSAHSFGVYIIHMFWVNVMYKVLRINPFCVNSLCSMLIIGVVVVCLSLVSVWVMKKMPILKKIL